MKKSVLLLVAAMGLLCCSESAEAFEKEKSFFQFSICPRLGTNGQFEGRFTNNISVNLTSGVSCSEKGFAVAGLSNFIRNDAYGMQTAGVLNLIKGNTAGLQISGIANISGNAKGLQLSGLTNVAKDICGVQIAGIVNVAGNVKGVQIGFVNVADGCDTPVGLVNIIRNGEMGLSLGYDAFGNASVLFRSGGKYTYGIIGIGYNPGLASGGNGKKGADAVMAECGIGVHIPCVKWFRINNEFTVRTIGTSSESPVWTASYKLMPGFKVAKRLEIFGGAELGYLFTSNAPYAEILYRNVLTVSRKGICGLYLGWSAGINFLF